MYVLILTLRNKSVQKPSPSLILFSSISIGLELKVAVFYF